MNYQLFGQPMNKSKNINIRITEQEKQHLKDQARKHGISLSKYVLDSVKKKPITALE
jgi:predicted DNA binding CopG/RHH family protein